MSGIRQTTNYALTVFGSLFVIGATIQNVMAPKYTPKKIIADEEVSKFQKVGNQLAAKLQEWDSSREKIDDKEYVRSKYLEDLTEDDKKIANQLIDNNFDSYVKNARKGKKDSVEYDREVARLMVKEGRAGQDSHH
ncbi:hypothetical protein AKO1_011941 [Acrasis kona]|uniref:Uncharacterized protein n=1 Tax=Acrasis kona TaxID=1008807 RepID=A0AAW2Z8X7_9EUKA